MKNLDQYETQEILKSSLQILREFKYYQFWQLLLFQVSNCLYDCDTSNPEFFW